MLAARPAAVPLVWAAVLFALVLVLYGPVIDGRPFVDDWIYVFENPGAHIARAFGELHPYVFYRPLPLAIISALHLAGGGSPVPIHLLQFVLHALLALLVMRIARDLGISPRGQLLVGLFVAVTQAAAAAVGGYDTLSLSLSTLLGTASLGAVVARRSPILTAALFGAALLCKESALGYLPLLLLFAFAGKGSAGRVRGALPLVAALLALSLAYVAWRAHLGGFAPTPGEGVYNMNFGPSMIRNLAMLWFAALLPVSSVDVFTSVATRDMAGVVLGGAAAVVVLVLALAGWAGKENRRFALWLLVAGSVAVSPVLPLNRVSELYAYTLMPFLALLFGASVARLEGMGRKVRGLVRAVAVVVLVSNAVAANGKAVAMERNGQLAGNLLGDLLAELAAVPPGGTVALIDPLPAQPNYSVFRVHTFLLVPNHALVERSGRSDVTLVRIKPGEDGMPDGAYDLEATLDDEARLRVLSARR